MTKWRVILAWLLLAVPMASAQDYKLEAVKDGIYRFTADPTASMSSATWPNTRNGYR